jgi:pyruvate kinase
VANSVDIERVSNQLEIIREHALEFEASYAGELALVHPKLRLSAKNLLHYLALRQADIRELQEDLAILGLASLGQAERNVMASIHTIQGALSGISTGAMSNATTDRATPELRNQTADIHKQAILGKNPVERNTSIMVTLPTEAATDEFLIPEMLAAGMNVARINCAHDDDHVWAAMIKRVRDACADSAAECRIFMDLAGPKVRTGELEPGPRVFHIRPRRDPMGRIVAPRHIRFVPDDVAWSGTKAAVIPVPRECIEYALVGDDIRFRDSRGKKRRLKVIQKDDKGLVLEIFKGAYICSGTKLRLRREKVGEKLTYRVGNLPMVEQPILLRPGDTLILQGDAIPGAPALEDDDGHVIRHAHISCRQPEVFKFVATGDRVSLNDGKITGMVQKVDSDQLEIQIKKAKPTGSRLRGNRGINFPDSDIRIAGLTSSDKEDLKFVIEKPEKDSITCPNCY